MQQRAPANLRQHLRRIVLRLGVLLSADLLAFALVRAFVRSLRDHMILGVGVAEWVAWLVPPGSMGGLQYASALVLGLLVTGNYGAGDGRRNARRLFAGCALATALPLWLTAWTQGLEPVLLQYAVATGLMWTVLLAERLGVDRAVARARPRERERLDTLFVGRGADCTRALGEPAFGAHGDYRRIGFIDTEHPPAPGAIGHVRDFPLLLAATWAQAVVICGVVSDEDFETIVETALTAGCEVLAVPRATRIAGVHPALVWRHGQALVELTAPGLKGWAVALKRGFDVCGAALGLVALSPLLGLVAILVRLESPGPVFFTQERVGRGGRRFRIIKFRTMVDGADARRAELLPLSLYGDAKLFKMPGDPRTTRLGRLLRRTSLDELPQLVNVLRGEMSLVGPRPPMVSEVAEYEARHYARFDVQPGITGPWQVAGRNEITDFERIVALETDYIRRWSFVTDLGILVKTVGVVLQMRGAH